MKKTEYKFAPGVDVKDGKLRLRFTFRGVRCAEILRHVPKVSTQTVTYANNKMATIKAEIREDRFDYAAHFPDSPRATLFSDKPIQIRERTVAQGVENWLAVQNVNAASSTYRNYASKAKKVTEKWPTARIADVRKSDLERFQASLISKGLSAKTVNDVFTIVRGVWSDAYADGVIDADPCPRIKNFDRDFQGGADPFTRAELDTLANTREKYRRPQDIDAALFACWTGLSESELLAIAWEDIDFKAGTAHVQRARVNSEYKVPKEKGRARVIHLIEPAKEILLRQRARTFMLSPVGVEVTQRDNNSKRPAEIRFVFVNDQPGGPIPWQDRAWWRWFSYLVKASGVRYRSPNQCRHTFASQLLSNYIPADVVAREMGHTGTEMIYKHYGKFIPADAPDLSGWISERLGFTRQEQTADDVRGQLKPLEIVKR